MTSAVENVEVSGNITQRLSSLGNDVQCSEDKTVPNFTRALQTRNGEVTATFPQAIAHRGYKAKYPENTMDAFKAAVEIGAHALETDVHLSKDGVIVLSHDATLKRCFGVENKIINCEWSFLETLQTLKEPKGKILKLKSLLEYLATPGLESIWLLLDIKIGNNPASIIQALASTIKEVIPSSRPWNQRIVLGCWTTKYIHVCKIYLPTYHINHMGFTLNYARESLPVSVADQSPMSFNIVQKILVGPSGSSFCKDLKKADRTLLAWTVNQRNWMRWCVDKELDGVITDDPKLFLEVCKDAQEGKDRERIGIRDYLVVILFQLLMPLFNAYFMWKYQHHVREVGERRKGS